MHRFAALVLPFLYILRSASLVLSNTPRANSIKQGAPQIIQPANLIQPENGPPGWATSYEIGSNLSIDISLDDTAPAQAFYELLTLAKEQVNNRTTIFGPSTPVPRRNERPELTQTIHAGLIYFIEPARALVPTRPGLEWGEFQRVTSWLFENLRVLLNHRECNFVLFRRMVVTPGNEVNLAFGVIERRNTTAVVDTAKLPAKSTTGSNVDTS